MSRDFRDYRRGARAILPMLIGVVPFGIVAGARPVGGGLGISAAMGFSTIVFAGASQLVAISSLISGNGAAVAIMAAVAINLRMMLYSASLAPDFGRLPLRDRMKVAYLLTDQAYTVTHNEGELSRAANEFDDRRLYRYYMGAGLTLWGSWQVATVVGGLLGTSIPKSVPIDFAVPLVFLVMLVPALAKPHAWVAAIGGGVAAVVAAEVGLDKPAVLIGALVGIAAGFIYETVWPDSSITDNAPRAEGRDNSGQPAHLDDPNGTPPEVGIGDV